MITKQQILEDFWETFPQYKEITSTYDDILFNEEELTEWNKEWLEEIWFEIQNFVSFNVNTIKELEEIIKLKDI